MAIEVIYLGWFWSFQYWSPIQLQSSMPSSVVNTSEDPYNIPRNFPPDQAPALISNDNPSDPDEPSEVDDQ